MGCVYQAKNKINGMCYIGKTIGSLKERQWGHIANGQTITYFSKAIHKYGLEGFEWTILLESNNDELLCWFEKYCIKLSQSKVPLGYNLTDGGEGTAGKIMSEEEKKAISIRNTGKKRTKEQKKRISESMMGRIVSKETRKKMSLKRKGVKHSKEWCEKISLANKGRYRPSRSLNIRQKISQTLKGHSVSIETRNKISSKHKGMKMSKEFCKRISISKLGSKQPESFKRKMSIIMKSRPRNPDGTFIKIIGVK
jgi:group I intron endonuclease